MKLLKPRETSTLQNELESVRRRLDRWRKTRTHRSAIPEALWASASALVGEYGLARTARALRLDYYSLKERAQASDRIISSEAQTQPAFMELLPQVSSASCECTIELEDRNGARMRIHLKGAAAPDLPRLSEGFWRRS
jgi:hypothetical protein